MKTRGVIAVHVPLSGARYTTTQAYMDFIFARRRLCGACLV